MLAGAIVVVAPPPAWFDGGRASAAGAKPARGVAGIPSACLEALGQSPLERVLGRLLRGGVQPVAVIAERSVPALAPRPEFTFVKFRPVLHAQDAWSSAEQIYGEYAGSGVEAVLVLRLGAYVEFNPAELLRRHRDNAGGVTRIYDARGPLDVWCVDVRPTPVGNALRAAMGSASARPRAPYLARGYVNDLNDAHDFRRFVIDGLLSRCALRPGGREIRPGVWVEETAQVHRRARVVAPAYIGSHARVRAASLITRFSNLERACQVDCGTVVEDASILPGTYLGPGLDVSHAVVYGSHLVDLRRNLALEIHDSKLIAGAPLAHHAVRPRLL